MEIKLRPIEIKIKGTKRFSEVAPVIDRLFYEIVLIRGKIFGIADLPGWASRHSRNKKGKTSRDKKNLHREYPMEIIKKVRQVYSEAKDLCKKYHLTNAFKEVIVAAILKGEVSDKDYNTSKIKTPHRIRFQRQLFLLHEMGYGYRKLTTKFKNVPFETIRSAISSYKSKTHKAVLN